MLNFFVLLAAATDPLDPVVPEGQPTKTYTLNLRDALLVIGVLAILALALFLWTYLTRKGHRRHPNSGAKAIYRADKKEPEHSSRRVKFRKKRREHADNLPRNPTLQETGGLPPVRPEEPSESA